MSAFADEREMAGEMLKTELATTRRMVGAQRDESLARALGIPWAKAPAPPESCSASWSASDLGSLKCDIDTRLDRLAGPPALAAADAADPEPKVIAYYTKVAKDPDAKGGKLGQALQAVRAARTEIDAAKTQAEDVEAQHAAALKRYVKAQAPGAMPAKAAASMRIRSESGERIASTWMAISARTASASVTRSSTAATRAARRSQLAATSKKTSSLISCHARST
jgi:hypothetical protein